MHAQVLGGRVLWELGTTQLPDVAVLLVKSCMLSWGFRSDALHQRLQGWLDS